MLPQEILGACSRRFVHPYVCLFRSRPREFTAATCRIFTQLHENLSIKCGCAYHLHVSV